METLFVQRSWNGIIPAETPKTGHPSTACPSQQHDTMDLINEPCPKRGHLYIQASKASKAIKPHHHKRTHRALDNQASATTITANSPATAGKTTRGAQSD